VARVIGDDSVCSRRFPVYVEREVVIVFGYCDTKEFDSISFPSSKVNFMLGITLLNVLRMSYVCFVFFIHYKNVVYIAELTFNLVL